MSSKVLRDKETSWGELWPLRVQRSVLRGPCDPWGMRGEWAGAWQGVLRPSLHHTKWRHRCGKSSRLGWWRTWLAVLHQRVGPGHEQPIGSARLLAPIRTWLPRDHGSAMLLFHNFPLSTPTPLLPPCLFHSPILLPIKLLKLAQG